MDINDKLSAAVCGCKTPQQLDCALTYAKLARKAKLIGEKQFHFVWGSIVVLKSILLKKAKGE